MPKLRFSSLRARVLGALDSIDSSRLAQIRLTALVNVKLTVCYLLLAIHRRPEGL